MLVRTDRPRLWLTPAILATLRARSAKPTARWLALRDCADRAADWDVGVIDYSLAYAVTGNAAYADRAISLTQNWINGGLASVTGDSGLKTRESLHATAACFDHCHSRLTPAQISQWVPVMESWSEWVWPETTVSRKGAWGVDNPGSNYYLAFLQTLTLGLSIFGDSPKAQSYIDLGLKKLAAVQAYLVKDAAGGYWLEGSSYGAMSTRFLMFALNAVSTATDQDLLTPFFTTGWGREMVAATIALTTPTLDKIFPSGDGAQGPINDMQRGNMLVAASRGVPGAKEWLDTITLSRVTQRAEAWLEFAFYPEGP